MRIRRFEILSRMNHQEKSVDMVLIIWRQLICAGLFFTDSGRDQGPPSSGKMHQ